MALNPSKHFVETTSAIIDTIATTPGTAYFVRDTGEFAFDTSTGYRVYTNSVFDKTSLELTLPAIKGKIYYNKDTGDVYHGEADGTYTLIAGPSTRAATVRDTATMKVTSDTLQLGGPVADSIRLTGNTLLVFCNSVFLQETIDYNVIFNSDDTKVIKKINNDGEATWTASTSEPRIFSFILYKHVPGGAFISQ